MLNYLTLMNQEVSEYRMSYLNHRANIPSIATTNTVQTMQKRP